jgi:hypothetical protein
MNAAHETHRFGIGCPGTGEHDELKPAGTHQLVSGTQRVGMSSGTDEQRTVVPEGARDGLRAIDPRGAFAVGDRGVAGRAENRGDATPRFTNGDSSQRKSAVGKCAVELADSRRHRPRCSLRNRNGVRKLLLDESAEGGSRHLASGPVLRNFRGEGTYTE